jgi:hypothetical protein
MNAAQSIERRPQARKGESMKGTIVVLAAGLLCFASQSSAQLDRDLGLTIKRNLGATGFKPFDDFVTKMNQKGAVPAAGDTAGSQTFDRRLNDSFAFMVNGSCSFISPADDHEYTYACSYVGTFTLDGSGKVSAYSFRRESAPPGFATPGSCNGGCGSYSVSSSGEGTLVLGASEDPSVEHLDFNLVLAEGEERGFLSLSFHRAFNPFGPMLDIESSAAGEMRRQ